MDNLKTATASVAALEASVNRFLTTLNEGEGTVAQLLNTPKPLEDVRRTLQNVDQTMNAVTELSQRTERQLEQFDLPQLGWDYELRYLSLEERLHNELAFLLSQGSNAHYRLGIGVRDEKVRFEFQYTHDVTDFLRARAGFMRSRVGAATGRVVVVPTFRYQC